MIISGKELAASLKAQMAAEVATFEERYAMVEKLMEDDTIPKLRKFAGKELGKKYGRIARKEFEGS